MASRELKNTDEGAPQLAGNSKNTLNAVLKAALVNGYGGTASLGWDLAYESVDEGICVFRPKIGSRMFLQIIDDGTSYSSGRFARAISYESMHSATLGVMPCPAMTDSNGYIHKTSATNNLSIPWRIIGDERGFYLITNVSAAASNNIKYAIKITYFGEGVAVSDSYFDYKYNWLHFSNTSGLTDDSLRGKVMMMRDPRTGVRGNLSFLGNWDVYNFSSLGLNRCGNRSSYTIGGALGYVPFYVNFDYNIHICNLPGMFEPLFPIEPYKQYQIIYEDIDENNKIVTLLLGQSFGYSTSHISWATNEVMNNRISILIGDKFRNVF